jgi:large subunit ribosomal protein L13
MKSFSLKADQVKKNWILIDADGLILGRLSAIIAKYLRGKHKPEFTPNMDCGDYVVVINAEKVQVTGDKLEQSVFYWHTGYPGGIKQRTLKERLTGNRPEQAIFQAVERMLPKTRLGRKMLKNLRVCCGSEHKYAAQKPVAIDVASMNAKNVKRG